MWPRRRTEHLNAIRQRHVAGKWNLTMEMKSEGIGNVGFPQQLGKSEILSMADAEASRRLHAVT